MVVMKSLTYGSTSDDQDVLGGGDVSGRLLVNGNSLGGVGVLDE